MKLLLLTCFVAFATAAPSERIRRDILPGDARYHAEHQHHQHHHVHQHRENEAEIARALSSDHGCLSSLGLAKGYGLRRPVGSTDSLKTDVETAGVESYGAETAAEQPASIPDESLAVVKEEPINSDKPSGAVDKESHQEIENNAPTKTFSEAYRPAEAAEASPSEFAQIPEPAKSDVENSHYEKKIEPETKYVEASPSESAQIPEPVKSDVENSYYEKKIESETKYASHAEKPVLEAQEVSPSVLAPKPESAKSDFKDSHYEEKTEPEAKYVSHAEYPAEAREASPSEYSHKPQLAKSNVKNFHHEEKTEQEATHAGHAKHLAGAQEASPSEYAHKPEPAKSNVKNFHHEEKTEQEAKHHGYAKHLAEAQEASPSEYAHKPEPAKFNVKNFHHEEKTEPEAQYPGYAKHLAEAQEPSPSEYAQKPELAKSDVQNSHPEKETKFETRFSSPTKVLAEPQEHSVEYSAPTAYSAKSNVEKPQHQEQIKPEAKSASQDWENNQFSKGSPDPSQSAIVQPATATKSYGKAPSSESAPAADNSATPSQSKVGSPFNYAANFAARSPVNPAFPLSPFAPTPFYNPGVNAFDQGRYDPNFHARYTPGFDGYNGNPGLYNNNYYPGHPFGFGTHTAYDQGLKTKAIIDPNVPFGFPHPYPVDYAKNVPFPQAHPFQFRTGYPLPQPVAPFPAIQQTKGENRGEETSQYKQQLSRNYQNPGFSAQPTAASYQQSAANSAGYSISQ